MWEDNNDDILTLKSCIKSIISSFDFLSIFSTWTLLPISVPLMETGHFYGTVLVNCQVLLVKCQLA